jgi:hypothetical protein
VNTVKNFKAEPQTDEQRWQKIVPSRFFTLIGGALVRSKGQKALKQFSLKKMEQFIWTNCSKN